MSFAYVDTKDVCRAGGRARLYVDGCEIPPLWYALSDIPAARTWNPCSRRGIRNFAKAGIDVVCIDTNLHECWREDGSIDVEPFVRHLRAAAEENPRVRVVARLHINAPYHWLRQHREECIVFYARREDDTYERMEATDHGGYGDRTIARPYPAELRASPASEVFLRDTSAKLAALCHALKAHPLAAEHLNGIQIAYGTCGEWHMWGDYEGGTREGDYSEPMQRLFRRVVRERHPTLEQLRRHYGERAEYETVTMSPPEERLRYIRTVHSLLSPAEDARIADTLCTLSRAMADAIITTCTAVREAWGEGLLVGTFYAYFFLVGAAYSAHFEPHRVLTCPAIDFVAAPSAYYLNKLPGNLNMVRYVAESCRLHGKLFIIEMDQGYVSWDLVTHSPHSCNSAEEYVAILRRNVLENLMLGHGAWYYDHRLPSRSIYEKDEYWADPRWLAAIADIQGIARKMLTRDYKKTTDVLVVVDTETRYYTAEDPCPFPLFDAISKCGVGFDRLYLRDLPLVDLSRYRAVLFLSCRVMSDEMRAFIRECVMTDGRAVLLIGGFAEATSERLTPEACADFDALAADIHVMSPEEVTADRLRQILRVAGVHVYTDGGEAVIADGGLVLVHTLDTPTTVLHLSKGDITLQNGACSTHLIDVETGEPLTP